MSYIGNTPTSQAFAPGTDTFSGTGSQTAFTLSRNVATVNDILVVVNNVEQQPSNYTVSGTTLTFSPAPSSGTNNIYVRYLSTNLQTIAPQQGSVYPASMSTGGPTWDINGNINVANTFGFKNRLINGDMRIDQRNAGASVNINNGYSLDRWGGIVSQASKFTVQQNSASVTPPVGFINYLGVVSSSAYTVGSSEVFVIKQAIEGLNISDLAWGTANAATVTLSFWVRSSLTGTFGGALRNSAGNRSYPFSYTINSANTWEKETITIAGDTSGTWLTTNGIGIELDFSMGTGATLSGTAGAWAGANYTSATGATSVVGTSGATFYLTGVQLEKGSTATSFDYRPYGTELSLCQRYLPAFLSDGGLIQAPGYMANTTAGNFMVTFPVTARVSPTGITVSGTWSFSTSVGTSFTPTYQSASTLTGRCGISTTGQVANAGGVAQGTSATLLFNGCEL